MEQDGAPISHQEGELPDLFSFYANTAGENAARITMSVQRGRDDYGQTRCMCSVSITCPQSRDAMDSAASLAFDTALRYVNWGMRYLAPELPSIPGPYSNAGNRNTQV